MVTTITQPCRTGRLRLAVTAGLMSIAFLVAACGGSDPSADEARDKLMVQLTDSGVSSRVATCIVDQALARFEPAELVNSSGEATAEIDAALGDIVGACAETDTGGPAITISDTGTTTPETTMPETTMPETTIPDTAVPDTTEPDVDLTAFCAASEDVYIGLLAGDALEAPAPATMKAFLAELVDRIELAIVTAPNSEYSVQPNELLAAIQGFDAVLAAGGYDVVAVPQEELADEGEVVDAVQEDLELFLADCDTSTDIDAEATALAEELTALTSEPVPTVEGEARRAESADVGIGSDVPGSWTSELEETVDDRRIFIVGTDAEGFTSSWGVDGVRFTVLDTSVEYLSVMDEADAAGECTLLVEEDYEDDLFRGKLRRYEGCGEATEAVVIGANEIDGDGTVLVELQMIEFDQAVLDLITNSFAAGL